MMSDLTEPLVGEEIEPPKNAKPSLAVSWDTAPKPSTLATSWGGFLSKPEVNVEEDETFGLRKRARSLDDARDKGKDRIAGLGKVITGGWIAHDFGVSEDRGDDNDDVAKTPFLQQRLFQTILCVCVASCSGTYYAYGLYAEQLRIRGGFTQLQSSTIGIVLNVGVFAFRPILGYLHDKHGPNRAMLIACLLGGTGYLMIYFGVRKKGSNVYSVGFISFAFVLVGIGGGLGYMSALFTITSNYPPTSRAVAVSLGSASMGMSALLVSFSYRFGFAQPEGAFPNLFLLWSILMYIIFGAGFMVANVPNYKRGAKVVLISKAIGTYRKMIMDSTFWTLTGPFALVQGAGLMVVNQASGMAHSVQGATTNPDAAKNLAFNVILLYTLCSVGSRLVLGQLMTRLSLPTGTYLTISCAVMVLAQLIAAASLSASVLYLVFVLVGAAVGATWTVCITLLKLFATPADFGQAFGLMCFFPAFTGLVLNAIAGKVYDELGSKASPSSPPLCYGAKCYRTAFVIGMFYCIIGGVWSWKLIALTRNKNRDEALKRVGRLMTFVGDRPASLSRTRVPIIQEEEEEEDDHNDEEENTATEYAQYVNDDHS